MASSDLKRVGLIFDADGTANFRKSLQTVNASLQENRSQFKLTKSTWDSTTSATEKLKQTNAYLAKQYDESAKKVSVLTSELAELENAEVKDEKAISKKKASLATAQTTMNNYKKGLDETTQKLKSGTAEIEAYAKKLDNLSQKTKNVGSSLTKNITAPIAGMGTAAMVAWNKIDDAYDNIAAGTGAVGDALSDLHDDFDAVYGSMPVEAAEASNAIAGLNTRFGYTGEKLQNASTEFLKFAKVNKTDVSSSVQLVTRAMGDASISADEYNTVLDALTAASQASGISIDVLTGNITKYGAPMRALGYTTSESIAIFASWEKAGVNTETAFSGMKKAISNFSAQGKDARVEFAKTLEEIKSCPDIASATTKAIEVFGTKAGPDLADAIKGGRFEFEEMLKVVEQSGGQLEATYGAMLSPADNAKIAMNNLTLAGAELGDVIQTALGPIFQKISEILQSVTQWFKGLDDNMKTIIVAVGALAMAIGPLLLIFGTLAGSVSKIMLLYTQFATASAGASGATGLLGGALGTLTAPIMAAIAAVALVVGAVVQLWNTNEQFRASVEQAIASIQEVFQNLWDTVLQPIFQTLLETFTNIWENGIKPLWDNWVEFVGNISMKMMELWQSIQPIVMWFIDVFGPVLTGIFDVVASIFGNTVTTMLNVAGALLSNIGEVISGIIQIFTGIIDFIKNVFTGNWSGAWDSVVSIFGGIFNTIVGVAKAPINLVIGFLNGMIGGVESGVNFCIKMLNKLSFDVPDWIPVIGGQHWGFDISPASFGRIPYLAKGGELLNGMSIVAEAGPELIMQNGNRTTVAPLTRGGGASPVDIIDYNKLAQVLKSSLQYMHITLDKDKVGNFVDERMLKAV